MADAAMFQGDRRGEKARREPEDASIDMRHANIAKRMLRRNGAEWRNTLTNLRAGI